MMNYLNNFVMLFVESAPWLLLGLLIAGFMKWIVPMELLQRHMGDDKLSSILKAAFIGAPLPLCSCGVIPAAIGLRRSGASKPSTISFLVATPETGVDSISVSYALLGPFFAIIRPISAILTAIYAGCLVKLFALNQSNPVDSSSDKSIIEENQSSCCSEEQNPSLHAPSIAKSCCESANPTVELNTNQLTDSTQKNQQITLERQSFIQLIKKTFSFASGKLLEDITKWLLVGLLLAAAIKTWIAADFLLQWGDGMTAMIIMALIGIPMYICATASTPLAAGFLAAGLSPGAILVFMLAGPATNIATMGMIRQEMGNSVLIAYLVSLFSASIGLGYLTNWLVSHYQIEIPIVAAPEHVMESSILYTLSAFLLASLMLRNLLKTKPKLTR